MTTKHEAVLSLIQVEDIFFGLLNSKRITKKQLRSVIRRAFKHYPASFQLKEMLKKEYADLIQTKETK